MAQPYDSAATMNLAAISAIIQQQYFPEFEKQYYMNGSLEARLFNPADDAVVGDGKTLQVKVARGDTGRTSTDMLADMQQPRNFTANSIKVRFNERDQTANDFTRFTANGRVSHWDIENGSAGLIASVAQTVYEDITEDYSNKLSLFRHLRRTGRVATIITSGKKNNDALTFADATSYTTGAVTCRIKIQNGPIAGIQVGQVFDIYTSAGVLIFSKAQVTDVNTTDNSVGLMRADSDSTANFDSVTTDHELFYSGTRSAGIYSMGEWFARPVSGDSFIGGVSRFTGTSMSNYRWLLPTTVGEGETAVTIKKADFDSAGDAIGFVAETPMAYVCLTDAKMQTALRQTIGNDAIIINPVDAGNSERFANFGSMGVHYQHPTLGRVVIASTPYAIPNTIRFINPGDWKALSYGTKGLRFMPPLGGAGGAAGMWYRLPAATPNSGAGFFYQIDAVAVHCDFCHNPRRQLQIINRTST